MTIDELARSLHTSREDVLRWASDFHMNDERLDGERVPRIIENYVRTKHLEETHPIIYRILDDVYSSDLAYERWVGVLREKAKGGA